MAPASGCRSATPASLIRAALEGGLADAPHRADPNFGLFVPEACPDVPSDVLQPKSTWNDKRAYDETAQEVAKRFEANFKQFADQVEPSVIEAGIRAAA